MDNFMIGAILFFGLVFFSRIVSEKATKKLSVEKKAELIDLFSSTRNMSFGLSIGLLALFFLELKFKLLPPITSLVIYIILLLAVMALLGRNSYTKLKSNDFPNSFIKSYLTAVAIKVIGIVLFFGFMILTEMTK
ncbi:MAG: hypothetical protein AB8B72_13590 [Crocinitomicaceae bacterium]